MLNWSRRKKVTPAVVHTHPVSEKVDMQVQQATTHDYSKEVESKRKIDRSQEWMHRVQESLALDLTIQFAALSLGNHWNGEPAMSRLKAIKLSGNSSSGISREYPKGTWEKQRLVIHFKDLQPAIEGYKPIVSQMGVGLAPHFSLTGGDLIPGSDVNAFVYDDDEVLTPRLARRHQLMLVKDLTALGINLNQQLAQLGWCVTHINLERTTYDGHSAPTGKFVLHIGGKEEVKYKVLITKPLGYQIVE